jgi:HlyD family secretion protein
MDGVLAWLTGLVALIPGLGAAPPAGWSGYVEADYFYAAAPSGGTIARLAVAEGDRIAAGDTLFVLDASQQQAQYDAAAARAEAAAASLDNLRTGSRAEEVDVIRASLAKAEADLSLARQNFSRSEELFGQGLIPAAQLDQGRATLAAAQAAVAQLEAQLKVAELPARDAQQIAAEASLAAAHADAAAAKAALDARTVVAPTAGRVERLFFKAGEVAGTGVPVVALLGAEALKVEFYVAEAERAQLSLGERVAVRCDGCPDGLTATISRFAATPQFTPPIIYSRDERGRLVFLTEAVLDGANGVLPGQPVSIGRPDA